MNIPKKIECKICNIKKHLSEFAKNKPSMFGIIKTCKICYNNKFRRKVSQYESNRYFGGEKSQILKRDGYKCQSCGMTNAQHKAKWKRTITIDHINGKGRNSEDKDNRVSNLITLCLSCHGRKDHRRKLCKIGNIA